MKTKRNKVVEETCQNVEPRSKRLRIIKAPKCSNNNNRNNKKSNKHKSNKSSNNSKMKRNYNLKFIQKKCELRLTTNRFKGCQTGALGRRRDTKIQKYLRVCASLLRCWDAKVTCLLLINSPWRRSLLKTITDCVEIHKKIQHLSILYFTC